MPISAMLNYERNWPLESFQFPPSSFSSISSISVFITPSLSILPSPYYYISMASIMMNVGFFSVAFCTLCSSLWPLGRVVGYFWSFDHGRRS